MGPILNKIRVKLALLLVVWLLPQPGHAITCTAFLSQLRRVTDHPVASVHLNPDARQRLDQLFDTYDLTSFEFPTDTLSPLSVYFRIITAPSFRSLSPEQRHSFLQRSLQASATVPTGVRNDVWKLGYRTSLLGREMEKEYPSLYEGRVIRGADKFAAHANHGKTLVEIGVNQAMSIPHELFHAYDHNFRFSGLFDFRQAFEQDGGWAGAPYFNVTEEAFAEGSAQYFHPFQRKSLLTAQPALGNYFKTLYGPPAKKEMVLPHGVPQQQLVPTSERQKMAGKSLVYLPNGPRWFDPKTGEYYFVLYDGSPDKVKNVFRLVFDPAEKPAPPRDGVLRAFPGEPPPTIDQLRRKFLGE